MNQRKHGITGLLLRVTMATALLTAFATCTLEGDIQTVREKMEGGGSSGTESNPIRLTANTWANGSITSSTSDGAIWYSFNVTSMNAYYIWWNDGDEGDGTKTLDVIVYALFYEHGVEYYTSGDSGWTNPLVISASSSGTVRIMVVPNHGYGSGTFAIAYNTSGTRPSSSSGGGSSVIDLTYRETYFNTLPAGAVHQYRFFGSSSTYSYLIAWHDVDNSGATADIIVGVRREGLSSYIVEPTDYGNSSSQNYIQLYVSTSGYYIIEVQGYSSNSSGSYDIVFY